MDTVALILSIIGCLNWGLVGIFQFDLVAWLFGGAGSLLSRLVYTIIGLAGLWCIPLLHRREDIVEGEYNEKKKKKGAAAFFNCTGRYTEPSDRRRWR